MRGIVERTETLTVGVEKKAMQRSGNTRSESETRRLQVLKGVNVIRREKKLGCGPGNW